MNKKIFIKVYKDNKFISDTFMILKYEGHFEVVKSIYNKKGYEIEIVCS